MTRSLGPSFRYELAVCVLVLTLSACAKGQVQKSVTEQPDLPIDYIEARTVTQGEREQFLQELPRLKDIQSKWEDQILSVPGVTSIGIGRQNGLAVFVVTTEYTLNGDEVPRELDGISVVLEERGPVRLLDGTPNCNSGNGPPCHVNQTAKPMEMGNSARWFQLANGCTAGFKACDLGTGRTVFVTNSHCAQFAVGCALAPLGDSVWHAALGDAPASGIYSVGEISGHAAPMCGSQTNFVDATKIDSLSSLSSASHRDIGDVNGILFGLVPPEVIHYSGRSSGHAFGSVLSVNVTVAVPSQGGFCCGPLTMRDQVSFDPIGTVMQGDSGSGVLTVSLTDPDMDRKLVGLLWATDNVSGYFNSIVRVLATLNLTADLTQCESDALKSKYSGYDSSSKPGVDVLEAE